jgi:EAL domain-containing protein (putative c-di-GMP-specific phosphodiesterase class I)
MTSRQLASSAFVPAIAGELRRHGLSPSQLAIEVTERVLMEANETSMNALRTMRAMGATVGIDDFGTGYSSLAYLRQFPLDFLKIDRTFIQDLCTSGETRAVVAAIIDLSHALNLTVVAEGVETVDQLDELMKLGCDQVQGYLIARPSGPAAVTPIIEKRSLLPTG